MGKELFLNSLKVSPTRLVTDKFVFIYPKLSEALNAIKKNLF